MDNFDANAKKEIKLMKSVAKKCVKPIQLDIFSLCVVNCAMFSKKRALQTAESQKACLC